METHEKNVFLKFGKAFGAVLGAVVMMLTIVGMVSGYGDLANLPLVVWVSVLLAIMMSCAGWAFFTEIENLKRRIRVLESRKTTAASGDVTDVHQASAQSPPTGQNQSGGTQSDRRQVIRDLNPEARGWLFMTRNNGYFEMRHEKKFRTIYWNLTHNGVMEAFHDDEKFLAYRITQEFRDVLGPKVEWESLLSRDDYLVYRNKYTLEEGGAK